MGERARRSREVGQESGCRAIREGSLTLDNFLVGETAQSLLAWTFPVLVLAVCD